MKLTKKWSLFIWNFAQKYLEGRRISLQDLSRDALSAILVR